MSTLSAYQPVRPVEFVLKIREIASDSWWVYRHEIMQGGILKQMSRVVFFGRSKAEAEQWINTQRQEGTVYILSDN